MDQRENALDRVARRPPIGGKEKECQGKYLHLESGEYIESRSAKEG